jgi:hypothetical protein
MNRPDKHYTKLSKTEKELGGIPNTSEDIKAVTCCSYRVTYRKICRFRFRWWL